MAAGKERQPERGYERKHSSNKGPQHVPKDFLDENYHYRFVFYSSDTMWKALEKERLGYEPVKQSELAGVSSKVVVQNSSVHDGLVTIPERNGAMSVLMRIPKQQYLDRIAEEAKEREAERKRTLGDEYSVENVKPKFTFNNTNSN